MTTATEFVPAELDATKWENLEPFYTGLAERTFNCPRCLEKFILDRSQLDAASDEAMADLYIAMTCHTDDENIRTAYETFVTEVQPKLKTASFELDRKVVESEHASGLDQERYGMLLKHLRTSVELFREENVAIETEITLLDQKYDQLCGAMTVELNGEEMTLQQAGRFLEETDRDQREAAWRATAERRLKDREAMDDIFDQMIAKRHQLAVNAGFENFRDYQHARMHRYDYAPADCERFHQAVEEHCVPVMRKLNEQRKSEMNLDTLRPWDLSVDVKGRDPLHPFNNAEQMVRGSSKMFHRMDDRLGKMFDSMRDGESLDLESRIGKAPGGYQYNREKSRKPFIFMNAVGLQRDLETMVHEAGHAFHSILCKDEPIMAYRSAPMEFCEVASMSMELMTFPYLDEFYEEEEADRARRGQLESLATLMPWIATIDAFQHWIYTNHTHDRAERTAKWLELAARFGADVDFSGIEDAKEAGWQRQGHLFGVPFYYIEYGIAQLGALQVWLNSLEEEEDAIALYIDGLSLGGTQNLHGLFAAAGAKFDFGTETVGPLMDRVAEELSTLPA